MDLARWVLSSPFVLNGIILVAFLHDYGPPLPTSFHPVDLSLDFLQSSLTKLLARLPYVPKDTEVYVWKRLMIKAVNALPEGGGWGAGLHIFMDGINRMVYGVRLDLGRTGRLPSNQNVVYDVWNFANNLVSKIASVAANTAGQMTLMAFDRALFRGYQRLGSSERESRGRRRISYSGDDESPKWRPRRQGRTESPPPRREETVRPASAPQRKAKAFVQEGPAAAASASAASSSAAAASATPVKTTQAVDAADEGFVSVGRGKPRRKAKTKEVLNIPPPILEYFDVKNDPHFIRAHRPTAPK